MFDEETELYYLRSRYYNPVWKRFANEDSYINLSKNLLISNLYAYCHNNPTCHSDKNGNEEDMATLEMFCHKVSELTNGSIVLSPTMLGKGEVTHKSSLISVSEDKHNHEKSIRKISEYALIWVEGALATVATSNPFIGGLLSIVTSIANENIPLNVKINLAPPEGIYTFETLHYNKDEDLYSYSVYYELIYGTTIDGKYYVGLYECTNQANYGNYQMHIQVLYENTKD